MNLLYSIGGWISIINLLLRTQHVVEMRKHPPTAVGTLFRKEGKVGRVLSPALFRKEGDSAESGVLSEKCYKKSIDKN